MATQEQIEELFPFLIGLPFRDAVKRMAHKYQLRILKEDGIDQVADSRFVEYRINVEVREKKVVALLSVG